jgi:hypothetical protein
MQLGYGRTKNAYRTSLGKHLGKPMTNLRNRGCEVNGTGSGSCPMVGFQLIITQHC